MRVDDEPGLGLSMAIAPRYCKLAQEVLRFAASTGLSAAISFALPIALHEVFGVREQIAVAASFMIALTANFLMLRLFVFGSAHHWMQDLWRYAAVNGTFRLFEYLAFLGLMMLAGMSYIPSLLIVLIISTLIKFVTYRYLFRR